MISDTTLQFLVAGVTVGAIYALVALAFVVLYKATDVLNFATGEFFMLSAFLAVVLTNDHGLPYPIAILIVTGIMAVLGALISRVVMRRLIGASFFSLALVTLGFGIIIRAFVLVQFGPSEHGNVSALPDGVTTWGNLRVPHADVVIVLVAVALMIIARAAFTHTRVGLHMRAVAENLEAATASGIDVNRSTAVSWMMSLGLAGIGGSLFAAFTASVGTHVADVGLRAFPAVLVGGLDSLAGAVLGGFVVGVIEQVGAGELGAEWRDFISFSVLFLVIIFRPTGLFGSKQLKRI
jgi:branched-chain amino acid transport system permease protein